MKVSVHYFVVIASIFVEPYLRIVSLKLNNKSSILIKPGSLGRY